MSQHRFELEKYKGMSTRHTCPECGEKRCFVRYIDTEGSIDFPDHVGRCNREDKCGYHFTPKQYFEQNPERREKATESSRPAAPPPPPKPTSYIDSDMLSKTLKGYENNNFAKFLSSHLGEEAMQNLCSRYLLGSSKYWSGATVFWQIDIEGKVRTGKIMLYDPKSGRRVKDPHPHITWVHSALKEENFNLKQCFFGEHLLTLETEKTVAIVESEKSAMIAAHYLPSMLWLATGGKNGCLNRENIIKLRGRKVILFPDLGATEEWRSKADLFEESDVAVRLFDYLDKRATDAQRNEGYDIADFLLESKNPHAILRHMIEKNPAVESLIVAFSLEIDERAD